MNYFFGTILTAVGIFFVLKTEWFLENFGTINWAEENMGSSGGSRLAYKLIGIALVFFGFLLITGMMGGFLMGTIGKLFIRQ